VVSYTVIYRVGGRENFEWNRTVEFGEWSEAKAAADEVRRGGRAAFVFRTDILDAEERAHTFDRWDPTLGSPYRREGTVPRDARRES
jgi:hypothetical protein